MSMNPIISAHRTTFWQAIIFCAAAIFSMRPIQAQFTGDYQTNVIDGTAVNSSIYFVGSNYVSDALFI